MEFKVVNGGNRVRVFDRIGNRSSTSTEGRQVWVYACAVYCPVIIYTIQEVSKGKREELNKAIR